MEFIGQRISILNKENEKSIVIISFIDKTKNKLLLLWLLLWSLSGLIIFINYFLITDPNTKTAIIVWMGFWAYFEYKIFYVYLWRKSGKEKIKIRDKKLLYKLDVSGKGKIKEYELDVIKNLRLVAADENTFAEILNSSYWMIADEKLTFDYKGKEIKLAYQLNNNDAKALLNLLIKELK